MERHARLACVKTLQNPTKVGAATGIANVAKRENTENAGRSSNPILEDTANTERKRAAAKTAKINAGQKQRNFTRPQKIATRDTSRNPERKRAPREMYQLLPAPPGSPQNAEM